jgi:uncharacterized protein with HEPN domain
MILYRLGQVGEIAGNMDRSFRDVYKAIPWKDIIGLRQRLFHFYGAIDMNIVYEAATMLVPVLINELEQIVLK